MITYKNDGTGAVVRTIKDKLGETVSVKDFGAVGDGVTDDTAAIQAAIDSGNAVIQFPTATYALTDELVIPSTVKIIHLNKSTLNADFAGADYPNQKGVFQSDTAVEIHDGIFQALNTDYSLTYDYTVAAGWVSDGSIGSPTETYTVTTRDFLCGALLEAGSKIYNCKFSNFFAAARITNTAGAPSILQEPTVIKGCQAISCGAGSSGIRPNFNVSNAANVTFTENKTYFGSESTFPSCQNIIISNNYMFNPTTPTIDVGGSGTAGYEAKNIVIEGNYSCGRDPIVVERGCFDCVISNNVCEVTAVHPSGVGIGVTDASDSNQGIRDVVISNNVIKRYGDPTATAKISFSIKVSTDSGATSEINNVVVSGNSGYNRSNYGVWVAGNTTNQAQYISITNNKLIHCYQAIVLRYVTQGLVSGNNLNTTTYWGAASCAFLLNTLSDVTIKDNSWRGTDISTYGHNYFLSLFGTLTRVEVEMPRATLPNAGYVHSYDGGASGNIFLIAEKANMGNFTTTYLERGSQMTFASASAGGFIGEVITTGGASPTRKTFGPITA